METQEHCASICVPNASRSASPIESRSAVEIFEYEFISDDPQGLKDLLDHAFLTGDVSGILCLFTES